MYCTLVSVCQSQSHPRLADGRLLHVYIMRPNIPNTIVSSLIL